MGKRPTFSLPEGLKMDITADKIVLEYDGDVEIELDLGRRFAGIKAGGDLTVKLPVVSGDLVAGGVLRIQGDIDSAGMLHGREVVLGRQTIRCKSISADERITIGSATIACDVIIAPEINLDPKATGRVTVVESANERGATKIKGGFSLSDYEDMFGNSHDFLAQRNLHPLSLSDAPRQQQVVPERSATPVPAPPALTPRSARRKGDDEEVDDPLSLSLDDLEPLMDQSGDKARPHDNELHQRLTDALDRITACYEGTELPPAVEQLRHLVEDRDYDGLRSNITEVWNGLLGFHQKRGIRPHHQVTHAFNVIHGLVQS
jgi:hypothetical protein